MDHMLCNLYKHSVCTCIRNCVVRSCSRYIVYHYRLFCCQFCLSNMSFFGFFTKMGEKLIIRELLLKNVNLNATFTCFNEIRWFQYSQCCHGQCVRVSLSLGKFLWSELSHQVAHSSGVRSFLPNPALQRWPLLPTLSLPTIYILALSNTSTVLSFY